MTECKLLYFMVAKRGPDVRDISGTSGVLVANWPEIDQEINRYLAQGWRFIGLYPSGLNLQVYVLLGR